MRYRSRSLPALLFCFTIAGFWCGSGWFLFDRQPAQARPQEGDRQDREARLLFNTGSRLYRESSWREAAQVFGQFLERHPGHPDAPEAHYARGFSLNQLGQHALAVPELRAALKKEDARWAAECSFYLGRSLEALADGEPPGSEKWRSYLMSSAESYGRAARLHGAREKEEAGSGPSRTDLMMLALASQGEALYRGGFYREAVAALEPITGRDGLRQSVHYARGIYLLSLAHYAISQASAGGAGKKERARARKLLQEFDGPGLKEDPLSEGALFLLARLCHGDGDRRSAVDLYERIARRGGAHAAEAACYRAIALYESRSRQSLELAGVELKKFLETHPRHALAPQARMYRALCLFDLGRYAEAAGSLEAMAPGLAASSPFGRLVWLRLGQALLLKNPRDAEGALRALEQAFQISSRQVEEGPAGRQELAEVLYWRGEAHLARGDRGFPGAIQAFSEVADHYADADPQLAEKALIQAAHASLLAGKRKLCAGLSRHYRERYPRGTGRFFLKSLIISADNGYSAPPGELEEDERKMAARYYADAASISGDPAESRRLLYRAGLALYHQKKWDESAGILERLLRENREKPLSSFREPDVPFYLADALFQGSSPEKGDPAERERWSRAAGLFEAYVAENRKGTHAAGALVNLGYCQVWLGELDAARKTFEEFLKRHRGHPLSFEVRFKLANTHLARGDLEAASREYASAAGEAQEALPRARAYLQVGIIQRRLGKPMKALEALDRIEADGLSGSREGEALIRDARFHRAMALSGASRTGEAMEELRSYLKRYAGSDREPEVRIQLARLTEEKDPREALRVLEPLMKAPAGRKVRDQALYHGAWCYRVLLEEARKRSAGSDSKDAKKEEDRLRREMETALRELITGHPESPLAPHAMVELAQEHFNRKEYPEAGKWFAAAREILERKDSPGGTGGAEAGRKAGDPVPSLLQESLLGLGVLALEEGKYREARDLLDRAAAEEKSRLAPRALFHGAWAWMNSQGEKEAAERYRKLLGMKNAAGDYREESFLRLGECLHRLGKYEESVGVLKQMLREFPRGAFYHEGLFALGFAYQFQDDHDSAMKAYREVVAGTGAVVAARAQYHLGECQEEQGKFRQAAREYLTVVANFDYEGSYQKWVRRSLLAAGIAYQKAGETQTALKQFQELKNRFPDTDEGRAARRRLEEEKG